MRRAPIFVFIFFVVLSTILIITRSSQVSSALQSAFQNAFSYPRDLVVDAWPFKNNESEIEMLRSENKALLSKQYDMQTLLSENETLKSQIRDSGDIASSLVMAKVVGRIGEYDHPQTLIIDTSGIEVLPGMTVVLGNNLVGIVGAVGGSQARIATVFHPNFETVAATVETDAVGVARGGSGTILFEEVVAGDTLRRGDLVVSRGVEGESFVPEGVSIGKVVSTSDNPQAAFQTAEVDSLIDFSNLKQVFLWRE